MLGGDPVVTELMLVAAGKGDLRSFIPMDVAMVDVVVIWDIAKEIIDSSSSCIGGIGQTSK
jgi:hypothetical protein